MAYCLYELFQRYSAPVFTKSGVLVQLYMQATLLHVFRNPDEEFEITIITNSKNSKLGMPVTLLLL